MALDYGRRRIGVAASDPTRTIASPCGTVSASGRPEEPSDRLLELLAELEPTELVVGIPLQMDGSEGEMASEARRFGQALAERTGLPVIEWDERLTTAQARRELAAGARARRRGRDKGLADRVAAALILRGYLQRTSSG
ncbi:MAG: Holliday junction resolvase RuvX [Gemmatimonadota bacterium]